MYCEILFQLLHIVRQLAFKIHGFFGAWMLACLPRFHHPVFNVARFRQATDDKFFILLEAADSKFDIHVSRELLASTNPVAIEEVKA